MVWVGFQKSSDNCLDAFSELEQGITKLIPCMMDLDYYSSNLVTVLA